MADSANDSTTATRRGLLRRGLALTLTAPALAAALHISPALADDGDDDRDDGERRGPPNPPPGRARLDPFTSDLITVSQSASGGGDFTSSNPGTDPLSDGQISLRRRNDGTSEGRAVVRLRGAAASVSYEVFFEPFTAGKGRESLGVVGPTNRDGHLDDVTPADTPLKGTNRVGIFVVARTNDGSGQASKDEFVSSLGG